MKKKAQCMCRGAQKGMEGVWNGSGTSTGLFLSVGWVYWMTKPTLSHFFVWTRWTPSISLILISVFATNYHPKFVQFYWQEKVLVFLGNFVLLVSCSMFELLHDDSCFTVGYTYLVWLLLITNTVAGINQAQRWWWRFDWQGSAAGTTHSIAWLLLTAKHQEMASNLKL